MKKLKTITQKKQKGPSRQKSNLLSSDSFWKFGFLSSLGVSLISILIVFHLKAFSIFDTFLFARDDGWCDKKTEGLFEHCFGDFHQGVSPNFVSDPFQMTNDVMVLSVADKIIWKFGNLFYSWIGPKLTLYLFLLLYLTAILVGWYKLKKIQKYNSWFFLFGITSLPSILAISRMNNVCLVFPVFVLYLEAVQSKNEKKQIALLTLCCLFKPQLGALVVLDFINRKYRLLLKKIISIAFTIFGSIMIFYNFEILRIFKYISSISNYSNSTEQVSYFYPANVSIGNIFMVLYDLLGYRVSESKIQIVVSILVIAVLISCFLYPASENSRRNMYPIFFLAVFGLSGVVQPYYLLLLNPIILLTLFEDENLKSRNFLRLNFFVANSFLLIPLLKNWEIAFHGYRFDSYNQLVIYNLVPICTTLVYALMAIQIHSQNINQRLFNHVK